MPRACVIVLDGVGAGALPDAAEFGDEGSDTLGNVAKAREILEAVVKAYKQLPRHAQALNRAWYDVARRNLEG